jgi:hypothetical protein
MGTEREREQLWFITAALLDLVGIGGGPNFTPATFSAG